MSRLRLILAALIPLLVLGAWLASAQAPVWLAPRFDGFRTADGAVAPAACEAASLLRAGDARASAPGAISAEVALATAREAARQQVGDFPSDLVSSQPVVYELTLAGERRRAWVVTLAVSAPRTDASSLPLPAPAALVLIDAESGAVISSVIAAATAASPADVCPFDLRGALVDLARSTPFLLLAAYSGGLILIGAGYGAYRLITRRRAA